MKFKKLKLHNPLRQVQFQLFEKLTSANLFQIDQEKISMITYQKYKHKKVHVEKVLEENSKPFFLISENFFQSYRTKFSSFYVILLA